MRKLFQTVVHLQIRRRWLSARVLTWAGGDFQWEGVPEAFLGTDSKGRISARSVDDAYLAPHGAGRLFTAFAHPRTIIDGFDDTIHVVRHCIRQGGYRPRSKNLTFVVQILDQWEGGLSDIERRALTEMCRECGAKTVRFAEGPHALTPPEILHIVKAH